MPRRYWLTCLWLCLLLSACGSPIATSQPAPNAAFSPAAVASAPPVAQSRPTPTLVPAAATEPPAASNPSAVATTTSQPSAVATATSQPSATAATGTVVLRVPAGSGPGQVGVSATGGPSTFRIAADGSIRVLDAINKRLLFFPPVTATSGSAKATQTINLSFLRAPTDFAVTGNGDLYVLDAEGWTVDHLALDGKELHNIPINPSLKGAFKTISLTADGRVVGLGQQQSYVLITAQGPLPIEEQPNATVPGTLTVRSNASFALMPDTPGPQHQSLLINVGGIAPTSTDLGQLDGPATFLDINQGMQPYVQVQQGELSQIRRYALDETGALSLAGTLTIDQRGCRPALRSVYVDRPGDVYTMCVSEQSVTITRYGMSDQQGQPLPRFEQLVTNAPWSPGNLQAAPG